MQVELVVMQHRVQARLSTPWLEFDAVWLARQLSDGRPILRFEEIPFEWGEFRTLFRQVTEVLRRYDLLEQTDQDHLQQLIRDGRPTRDDVAAWYVETASRQPNRAAPPATQPEFVSQVLTLAARPFLARTVETLHQRVNLEPWTRAYCPFCGGDAELALLLRPGETRLACGRCTGVWPFPEHACPHCDNRLPGYQTVVRQPRRPLPPHRLRCLPALHQGVRRAEGRPSVHARRRHDCHAPAGRGGAPAGIRGVIMRMPGLKA